LNGFFGQRGARFLERGPPGFVVREAEFQTEGGGESFENAASGGNYFAADAVAWYEAWGFMLVVCVCMWSESERLGQEKKAE